MNHAFEDDFGGGRHLQVVATALHQFGAVAAQQAGEGVFGEAVRHRGHGAENGRGIGAQGHGYRERLARMLLAPLTVIQRAATVAQPTHDDLVAADHLLAIDAEVLAILVRALGDGQAPGDQRGNVAGQQVCTGNMPRSTSSPSMTTSWQTASLTTLGAIEMILRKIGSFDQASFSPWAARAP
jgi:hypothetical protein